MDHATTKRQLRGKDRLIVALDVDKHEDAMALVNELENVSFFKIGLQLFMAGDTLGLIQRVQEKRAQQGSVFLDLKLGGDIPSTVAAFVRRCLGSNVKFFTLVESTPLAITLDAIRTARHIRGPAENPRILMVPYLSSLDARDLEESGIRTDPNTYIVDRAKVLQRAGCDGLIVSGDAIKLVRDTFGREIDIVSPGIRPGNVSSDPDHKRYTTPSDAIRFGADYLVVGRPVTADADRRQAAQRIIDEIDAALDSRNSSRPGAASNSDYSALSAH